MEDKKYKVVCKYCGHKQDFSIEDCSNPDIENLDDVIEYDQNYVCKNCGCFVRVKEALEHDDTHCIVYNEPVLPDEKGHCSLCGAYLVPVEGQEPRIFTPKLPDTISIVWSLEDVKEIAEDLTDDECRQVLQLTKDNHDATIGVTWETLEVWADEVRSQRK